ELGLGLGAGVRADATAVTLCRDNKLPIVVFELLAEGNIGRAVKGEKIGTLVGDPGSRD
ncbi:UMP kinase, partial [Streptomyces sp. NPDC006386]